jgi:hypothetical protein
MQPHSAIIDEDSVAWLQGTHNFGMREPHAVLIPRRGIRVEYEFGTLGELDRPALEFANARFGTLKIEKNANWAAAFLLERPDHCDLPAHLIMRGVAHVDAKEIGASMKQRRYHCWICGRRSKRRNDLAPAQPPHVSLV